MRALTDCLIAAVAIRAGFRSCHAEPDFEALARHTATRARLAAVLSPGSTPRP